MRSKSRSLVRILWLISLLCLLIVRGASASTNSWTRPFSDRWDTNSAWSLGVRPDSSQTVFITNSGTKTVTIDTVTSGTFPSSLTVTNLTVGAPTNATNTLFLNSAGTNTPLHVLNDLNLTDGGAVTLTNSGLQADGFTRIGFPGTAALTMISGTVQLNELDVGAISNSQGTLNLNGGTLTFPGLLRVASGGSTGVVSMTGGTLNMTGSGMALGQDGTGQFNQSGGSALVPSVQIGIAAGSKGSLNLSGGTFSALQYLSIGNSFGAGPCSVTILTNGALFVTNASQNAYVNVAHNSSLTLNGGSLQVDNLYLTNGGAFTNISGTFLLIPPLQLGNGSSLTLSGGTNYFVGGINFGSSVTSTTTVQIAASVVNLFSNLTVAVGSNASGTISVMNGSSLNLASGVFGLGNDGTTTNGAGTANAIITNATLTAGSMILGSSSGGLGTLTLQSNSQVTVNTDITMVSDTTNTPSSITVSPSCSLNVSNGTIAIGPNGGGLMNISGTVIAQKIHLGGGGAAGKVVFSAGFVSVKELICNWWVGNGGDMDGNGGMMILGAADHDSLFQLDSGFSTNWGSIYVGYGTALTGTITNDGGVMSVTNNLIVGDCVSNSTGVVSLSGSGELYVTNTAHNAVLDVRKGSFLMTGGTLVVDILRVTNACGGTFSHSGGTLRYAHLDVDTNQSAVGDGIPNGWKLKYGLDPFDPTVAGADPDHDGMNNLAEYLAGTNPTNSASVFRMLGVTRTNGVNIRLDWTTVGGHSYVVQTNGDLSKGTFTDVGSPIPVQGTSEGSTNYIHVGGAATNTRFYRVRLGP